MKPLSVIASINTFTGYGCNAVDKIVGLLDRGHELFIRCYNFRDTDNAPIPERVRERIVYSRIETEWELIILPPVLVPTPGRRTVYCTTLECDALTTEQRTFLSGTHIIVPSRWNREVLAKSGLSAQVCPEGVDTSIFATSDTPKSGSRFVAGTACSGSLDRKGLAEVIAGFDFALGNKSDAWLIIKQTEKKPDLPSHVKDRIVVERGIYTRESLAEWYQDLDVFVSGSRAEGWGRMLHEAMACGTPVISANYGGVQDFLHFDSAWLLPYELEDAANRPGRWAKVDRMELARALFSAYRLWQERTPALEAMSRSAVAQARRFTLEKSIDRFESLLIKCGALTRRPRWKFTRRLRSRLLSDSDAIVDYYRSRVAIPKRPLIRREMAGITLTNHAMGLGDTMLLTPFSRVWSKSPFFEALKPYCPHWYRGQHSRMVAANVLQNERDLGNGHFIQRLHRALGMEVPAIPRGHLSLTPARSRNRVALHFVPGAHALWQAKRIHGTARRLSGENAYQMRKWMRGRKSLHFVEVGSSPSGLWSDVEIDNRTSSDLNELIIQLSRCEYFIGIMSGPMHMAAALGCKCIVIVNFPPADQIYLPTLKDIPQCESEWMYPQHVHLHQEGSGRLVKRLSPDNLDRAIDGELYPYWQPERFADLLHILF